MRESQKRMKEYRRALPHVKEKLVAVGLLLAVSASMLVTVTFAWVSLSTNPEVSGVNTSIASNGNLEIALASGTLDNAILPGATQIGDSNLETLERNITWGNLINLSDRKYGLENLVLRPAKLNDTGLLSTPLYGPVYDETGRMIEMNMNFGYAKWNAELSRFDSITESMFVDDQLGVRAITSMKYGEASENATAVKYNTRLNSIGGDNVTVQAKYRALANEDKNQKALASLMAGYMVENQLKSTGVGSMLDDASLYKNNLVECVYMYNSLIAIFEEEAAVLASLLNLQSEIVYKNAPGFPTITKDEILSLEANTSSKTAKQALISKGFSAADNGFVANIDQFLADYNTLKRDVVRIQYLIDNVSWSSGNDPSILWLNCPKVEGSEVLMINDIINNLVKVLDCVIDDDGDVIGPTKISGIGGTIASKILGKKCMTTINNGILYNFHAFSGGELASDNYLQLSVDSKMGNQKIESKIRTSATVNRFSIEYDAVKKAITTNFGEPPQIAKDTYGFAVDFWVRTNASGSYLTLQGNVLIETKTVDVTGKDRDGNETQLYTISVKVQSEDSENTSTESGNGILDNMMTASYDVYYYTQKDDQGNEVQVLLYANSHAEVTKESLNLTEEEEIPTPMKKVEEVEYVIGYEGDNRIWEGDEHALLSVNSTTQGSGSCYVFYAETPVDQERSLELLKSMKVAFVDGNGTLLATAYMDSDRHYADSGKVIVPMVLDSNSAINLGTDANGNTRYAITALEQNVATRITAIFYLDGTNLTNDDVLASADIEGHMNIQFGSSASLKPLNNETLYNSELVLSATLTGTSFKYGQAEAMTTFVSVSAMGTQPATMTANFIRRINATQGSPEESFVLGYNEGTGKWEGSYTFTSPGTYILRSVTVDGTERDLQVPKDADGNASYPTVVVDGFGITSVTYDMLRSVMTDAGTYSGNVALKFETSDPAKMPSTVVGKFLREGATVNVNFIYNPTDNTWRGRADFVSSGEYTMQYVVLDGKYQELASGHQFTIDLTLGMRVEVETISDTEIIYGSDDMPEELYLRVKIFDNSGNPIKALANADLYYSMGGTERLHTDLTWNANREYYEGVFKTISGTWRFSHVYIELGESKNTLTKVNSDAPVFTVIPPTPPTFVKNDGTLAQLLTRDSDTGIVQVYLKDSTSATVIGKLVKEDGTVRYDLPVQQSGGGYFYTDGDMQVFQFPVEDGLWTLKAVSVYNVFGPPDEEGKQKLYSLPNDGIVDTDEEFEAGFVFDSDDSLAQIQVAVLHTSAIKATLDYTGAADLVDETNKVVVLGKNADGSLKDTATFMSTHNLNDNSISITFRDDNNLISRGYFSLNDVKLSYKHNSTGTAYGGYSSDAWENLKYTIVRNGSVDHFAFAQDMSNTSKYVVTNASQIPFQYAAQYVADTLSYTVTSDYVLNVDGQKVQRSDAISIKDSDLAAFGTYNVEVYSKKPYVQFTATNPAAGTEFNGINAKEDANVTRKNVISQDGYSVTCYYQGEISSSDDGCGNLTNSCSGYTASKATTGIYNIGSNYSSATCTIVSKGDGSDITFSYSPSSQFNEQSIGSTSGSGSDAKRLGIGTNATATQLIVKDANGTTYTFTLENPLYATATE